MDSFDRETARRIPFRWENVSGEPWKIQDGTYFNDKPSLSLFNLPFEEGVVEAELHSGTDRNSQVALVGKYINRERYWYVRVAYWAISVVSPGQEPLIVGSYSLFKHNGERKSRGPVRIKLEIKDGRVGLYLNGILRSVFDDPLAGESGRPGLRNEFSSHAEYFIVRKTK